jgi:predicted pyridoxine 5'-phosphate oxidase superfamily flavin-nucleotide-binding protein
MARTFEHPFHSGELAVQVRAGERAVAQRRESVIRDRVDDAATAFVGNQALLAVAAAAPDGALWASLWCGRPGFLRGGADGASIEVLHDLHTNSADPVRMNIRADEALGALVIDLTTRRRLRINGLVARVDGAGLELCVRETFSNCPKYIQKRLPSNAAPVSPPDASARIERGSTIDDDRRRFIERVDTFFVASVHRERGIDASHRGGRPGFVRVIDGRTVRIPDYPGNSLFQTFGNFHLDPRCGLAFIDFDARRVLSTSGRAVLEFGAEDASHPTGGTGRYWSCTVDRWIEFPLPAPAGWTLVEPSPFNPV